MPDYDNTNKGVLFVNTYREEGDNKPACLLYTSPSPRD